MRIARFADAQGTHWGVADAQHVRVVGSDGELCVTLGDPDRLAGLVSARGAAVDLSEVRLLAPIIDPPQFFGVGLNYRDHARESGMEIPPAPVTFGFLRTAIIGDGDAIRIPQFTDQVDWEAELGIVIGRGGCDIPETRALEHVAGYTIVNDVSARDVQMAEGQWSRAKSFDTFKPMGPWIVTTDELGAAGDLRIALQVNGVEKQASSTSELIFSVPELVSRLSRATTLLPGTVISTGTPHGVGFSRTPPEFLRPGDVVSIEIEGIGHLSNPVVAA